MQFSSLAFLLSGLAFAAQAEKTVIRDYRRPGGNLQDIKIIGINEYAYETVTKPKLPLEEQSKECGEGVTRCLEGRNYLKCVGGKWIPSKCEFSTQSCNRSSMFNQCSEY